MPVANSPLRYPGGKAILSDFLAEVLVVNGIRDGIYIEPYAGGAGAALNLLFAEHVQHIVLNDADPCIFAFWNAILHRKHDFIRRLKDTPVTIDEWKRQREIYRQQARQSRIKVAFAAFYLNRCNRSGIIANGGLIGGLEQTGNWKLDARFNKDELVRRIEKIYCYRDRIQLYNMDAADFLENVGHLGRTRNDILVYLDPPYYLKGSGLYLNYYQPADHVKLASFIKQQEAFKWLMTYDDVPVIRTLYSDCMTFAFQINYSAHSRKKGNELLIHGNDLVMPLKRCGYISPALSVLPRLSEK